MFQLHRSGIDKGKNGLQAENILGDQISRDGCGCRGRQYDGRKTSVDLLQREHNPCDRRIERRRKTSGRAACHKKVFRGLVIFGKKRRQCLCAARPDMDRRTFPPDRHAAKGGGDPADKTG
ncbi:hypothetical protein SDC9_115809 [bioreactor metagenome]|uniref:Uncharacterized protein n=1 Tax=bioreactor metagenome TaxID=1076179 RepID=A0A645C4J2_9ZZZZ